MSLKKLDLTEFLKFSLKMSQLKSISGGTEYTQYNGDKHGDFIDNNEKTHFDCDPLVYEDGCSDPIIVA